MEIYQKGEKLKIIFTNNYKNFKKQKNLERITKFNIYKNNY